MNTEKIWNYFLSIILFVFGLGVIFQSKKLGVDFSNNDPGAGFWPMTLGLILSGLSLLLAIGSFFDKTKTTSLTLSTLANKLVYKIAGLLLLYLILITLLGFYISTFIFISGLMRLIGVLDNKKILKTALGTIIFIYLIFGLLLKVQFPRIFFIA